jgi:gamma-glutamyltranspeptidase/glutathione hydrolase
MDCFRFAIPVLLLQAGLSGTVAADDKSVPNPRPLAEGKNGVVVGTSGPAAVRAGLDVLKKGGTAADAALATALAQVVECGGSYVSHAGILGLIYFESATGKAYYLNAGYNTPHGETEPLTIPRDKPSGRSALVPGFMAGVQAVHDRFGKLPRKDVFQPAVSMAGDGIPVSPMLARFLTTRRAVLSRLPETKRLFTTSEGSFYQQGDRFRQPALARTLSQVAESGAAYMYTGEWAEQFVTAVQKEGGKIALDDLKAYRATWENPLRVTHRGHELCVPGFSGLGGVAMIEAMHLLAEADLPRRGRYPDSPDSLFWLMQIGHCQALGFVGPDVLKAWAPGVDLTASSRLKRETAATIFKQMQDGRWPLSAKRPTNEKDPPGHSDGVVVADRWGNVAAVTHSINTVLWGNTGLFVGGVSIPDSAAIQPDAVKRAGPGKRLPDPMCPLIVLKDGKPVLGSSAIGGGLHQKTLQMMTCVLDYQMAPQASVETPTPLLPRFGAVRPTARVEKDHFPRTQLDAVIAIGQPVDEVGLSEAGAHRGYWIGVHIDPTTGTRSAIGTRRPPLPSVGEGY